jgi:hypothetical protein
MAHGNSLKVIHKSGATGKPSEFAMILNGVEIDYVRSYQITGPLDGPRTILIEVIVDDFEFEG